MGSIKKKPGPYQGPGFGFFPRAPPVGVTHGDDAGVVALAVAQFVQVGDAATADNTYSIHNVLSF